MQAVDPAIEYDPAAQFEHAAVPKEEAMVPEGQKVHSVAPASEYVPIGHCMHEDCLVWC